MTEAKPELTLNTIDSRGVIPNQKKYVGMKFTHQGNGHVYEVVGWAWNGEDDTWMMIHKREGSDITYLRTPANFAGYMSDGRLRYVLA